MQLRFWYHKHFFIQKVTQCHRYAVSELIARIDNKVEWPNLDGIAFDGFEFEFAMTKQQTSTRFLFKIAFKAPTHQGCDGRNILKQHQNSTRFLFKIAFKKNQHIEVVTQRSTEV